MSLVGDVILLNRYSGLTLFYLEHTLYKKQLHYYLKYLNI